MCHTGIFLPWRETEVHCHPQNVSLNPLSPQCLAFFSEGLSSLEPPRYKVYPSHSLRDSAYSGLVMNIFSSYPPTPERYKWTSLIPLAFPPFTPPLTNIHHPGTRHSMMNPQDPAWSFPHLFRDLTGEGKTCGFVQGPIDAYLSLHALLSFLLLHYYYNFICVWALSSLLGALIMLNSRNEYVKLLGLWGRGMSVSLRKLPFCCWQCILRTNICLHLVARGLRQPLPATRPSVSPEQGTALGTVLVTDGQVAVLTSRNHIKKKDEDPESECLEPPVSLHLN